MGKNEAGGQDKPSQLPRESDKREMGCDKSDQDQHEGMNRCQFLKEEEFDLNQGWMA